MSDPDRGQPASDERVLVVIPDANVFIHGKALPDLPWGELKRPQIEVLFVAPVIQELDKLKNQSGRPNKIARQLSGDVRALLDSPDQCAEIRKAAPVVIKRVELRAFTKSKHDSLKLDHADQALINYALHLQDEGQDILLLTDDTICGTTARQHGLPQLFLPEHWLRDPEPDELSKENAKLKAEVHRLASSEPKVILDFRQADGKPVERLEATVTRWLALTEDEIGTLMSEVQQRFPPATTFGRPAPSTTDDVHGAAASKLLTSHLASMYRHEVYEPPTEEEIEGYRTKTYPEWLNSIRTALASLHDQLMERIDWPAVLIVASNGGTRPATDVILRISNQGAFTLFDEDDGDGSSRPREEIGLPLPPVPPRGRVKLVDPFGLHRGHSLPQFVNMTPHLPDLPQIRVPTARESDAFYWRTHQRQWVNLMEIECALWRHGEREIIFRLTVRPNQRTDIAGVIEVSVHATNISDSQVVRLPIRVSFVDGSTAEKARSLVQQLIQATHIQIHV